MSLAYSSCVSGRDPGKGAKATRRPPTQRWAQGKGTREAHPVDPVWPRGLTQQVDILPCPVSPSELQATHTPPPHPPPSVTLRSQVKALCGHTQPVFPGIPAALGVGALESPRRRDQGPPKAAWAPNPLLSGYADALLSQRPPAAPRLRELLEALPLSHLCPCLSLRSSG